MPPPENETATTALITNIQRYSIDDGPGIRTIVFLKGCNLHCEWCHNPECINPNQEIYFKTSKCTNCGQCAKTCQTGAINLNNPQRINREKCNLCMKCVTTCPNGALTPVAEQHTITQVLEEVKRDFLFYLNSHGGLTISGGEPLYHPNFTLKLLQDAKQLGIPTALETTGHAPTKALMEINHHTDLLLYDIKHMDPQTHKKHTGVTNKLILENLKQLANINSEKIIIRVPIIPNFNNSKDNIREIARHITSLGIYRIDLLPYHRFAETKYQMLNKPYLLKGKPDLTKEEIAPLEEIAQSYGLSTNIGGGRPTDTPLTPRKHT